MDDYFYLYEKVGFDAKNPDHSTRIDFSGLTKRQTEVLTYLARGLTNSEISQILDCAPGTVKNHVSDILNRLDVSNRTEAASEWARFRARASDEVGDVPIGT